MTPRRAQHRGPRVAFVLAALVSMMGATPSRADEAATAPPPSAPRNVVSTNPVRYAILHFQIEYERIVGERWSLFAAPIYFHHATWYPFAPSHDLTARGGGLDIGFRYTFGEAPAGFYVGPLLSAYRAEVQRAGAPSLDGYVFSGGVQGGYGWLVARWLVLSAGVGLSYGVPTDRAPDGSAKAAQLPHQGLWINFRANVGIAF